MSHTAIQVENLSKQYQIGCLNGVSRFAYRIDIRSRKWLKPSKPLPRKLKKMVEAWVEAHEEELLEQWERAQNHDPITIIG